MKVVFVNAKNHSTRDICEIPDTAGMEELETALAEAGWKWADDKTRDIVKAEPYTFESVDGRVLHDTRTIRICFSDLCEAREMHYGEYKRNYRFHRHGEYNAETKTIVVYIPLDEL